MSKSIMVQASQKLNLVGKLLDVNFGSGTLSDGRKYERATATIQVTQSVTGREETSEIPASFFATEFTSTGKNNPAWKSLQDLKMMKTVQNVGIDNASTVRITGAQLQENNFVSRNGQLINGWQLRCSFINETNLKEAATFNVEIFIMSIDDEIDSNGEETGRLKIKGGIVQYNGRLDVLDFVVENPDAIDFIRRNWENNDTLMARGYLRVTSVEEKRPSGGGWGEEIPDTTTKYVRELIISTGDDEGREEEFAYDPSEIKKAFNVRKAEIEQLQIDAKKKASSAPVQTAASTSASKYSWE